jgi:polar amino acid transport system substrate-binding protein
MRARLMPALAAALLALAGCQYPQDVEKTLERVTGGVLEVGATENPPWVIRTPDGAAGLEAELVRGLAEHLGAEIRWHWGTESELVPALEHLQLDLVIGGFVRNPRLSQRVALTNPYFRSRSTVGFPGDPKTFPESLQGLEVGVERLSPLREALRDSGAEPVYLDGSADPAIPVANASWWLRAHGYEPGAWELASDAHVMALPPGENAWMMAVQRYLDDAQGLARRLRELERRR